MEFAEAKELLLHHSFAHPDLNHPKSVTGFLGSLRPFTGLRHENIDEVMECLHAIADYLRTAPAIDRELTNALWAISFLARYWGCTEDGMLRRNSLISGQEIQTLSDWTSQIDWTVCMLLDGQDDDCAFARP